ncbi:HAD family hydrolase [Phytoactinopolyspora mesophila]|nr:HAD-IA family hydrolase [Phytoactinopolyspora mesophila]
MTPTTVSDELGRVAAVFFDSGGTLARPLGGDWWPKPRFAELIGDAGLPIPDDEHTRAALEAGSGHLARHQEMATFDDEVDVYIGFYRIVLRALYDYAPDSLVRALAEASVFELDQQPYEDTLPVLQALADSGIRLGIVSNAGPSLELRYRDMGLRRFFDPFVISAMVASEKPATRIYEIALERAALEPGDVVFVDDVAENVRAAAGLGMRAYLIDREGLADVSELPVLPDLRELAVIIGGARIAPTTVDDHGG